MAKFFLELNVRNNIKNIALLAGNIQYNIELE